MHHLTQYYRNLCEQLQEKIVILEGMKKALRSKDEETLRKELLRQAYRQARPESERISHNEDIEELMREPGVEGIEDVKALAAGFEKAQRRGHSSSLSDPVGWRAHEALSLRNRARDQSQRFNKNIVSLATALHGLRGLEAPPSEISRRPEYMGKQTEADKAIISAIKTATEGLKRGQYASSKERADLPQSPGIIRMRKNK